MISFDKEAILSRYERSPCLIQFLEDCLAFGLPYAMGPQKWKGVHISSQSYYYFCLTNVFSQDPKTRFRIQTSFWKLKIKIIKIYRNNSTYICKSIGTPVHTSSILLHFLMFLSEFFCKSNWLSFKVSPCLYWTILTLNLINQRFFKFTSKLHG